MVLPLADEDKPKCFLCHIMLKNYEELKKHQEAVHKDFFEFHEKDQKREPAPGDVSIF
jgi:hypothetical protein|tara:strand:+ start:2188 stop:2361 length:174 start_codon:yes stop_codon:yes gene_type:complete